MKRGETTGRVSWWGGGGLLCCQQKHYFMYAAVLQYCASVPLCVCVCVRADVFVLSFGCVWPYLPVHRDELNLSKFCASEPARPVIVCCTRWRVVHVHTRVMFRDAFGPSVDTLTVCFKPACGALCILHESTVLYVSNPFVCPNAQRKHKHSADLLFAERCLHVRASPSPPESAMQTHTTDISAPSRAHARTAAQKRNFEHRTREKSDFTLCAFFSFF